MGAVMHPFAEFGVVRHVRLDRGIQRMSDVVMQVAVAQVAEGEIAHAGKVLLEQCVGVLDELDDARDRNRNVVLHVAPR
jgi:hypothetical protein